MPKPVHPSNGALIGAAPLVAEVERLMNARSTPEGYKEPKGFAELMLTACGFKEANLAPEIIRKAIVLAFIMGVNYDE